MDRALRDDAIAAERSRCESVARTARRLCPLIVVWVDDIVEAASSDVMSEVAVDEEEKSNRFCAGCGITPPGNDDARRTGSSLVGGHISDPLP